MALSYPKHELDRMALAEKRRMDRNLNPTPQARVAMIVYGGEYANQRGGSMDFWDCLHIEQKRICQMVVDELTKHS